MTAAPAVGGGGGTSPGERVRLRYLATLPRYRASDPAAGQVLYLSATGIVVAACRRDESGWECVILTDPTGIHPRGSRCRITDLEIETALPVPLDNPLDGLDSDQFIEVWLGRVWDYAYQGYPRVERVNGMHLYAMARIIATDVCLPGSRTFVWDQPARYRIALTAHVLPPGQTRLIAWLTRQRLLSRMPEDPYGPPVLYLILPDHDAPEPPADTTPTPEAR